MFKRGTWVNGKKKVTGYWQYNRNADRFYIELDQIDSITGEHKNLTVYGDTPEWGNWKLEEVK